MSFREQYDVRPEANDSGHSGSPTKLTFLFRDECLIAKYPTTFGKTAKHQRHATAKIILGILQPSEVQILINGTIISEGCSTLSSGQIQRLFLARALYKEPKLLVLDEATNNLDLRSEQHVISAIKKLPLTLITIARRKESLTLAANVIKLEKGEIVTPH